uniref:TBC1 domain family member 30 n=1 Tax=Gasterosteus aculeatus aculeatus TaxID=481459 RepID=A0AAQ4NTD1_GASAC
MASEVKLNGGELLEVDICDAGVYSGDESGVFVNSAASPQDDFSGFHQWTRPAESPDGASSSPPGRRQQVPAGQPGAPRAGAAGDRDSGCPGDGVKSQRSSIVDCLLVELYETCGGGGRRNRDSWDSSTEASGSDAFLGRSNSGSGFLQELQEKHTRRHQMNYLAQKAPAELHSIIQEVKYRTSLQSTKLLRQLRRRDRLCHKLQRSYDIITACLQAVSQKRRKNRQCSSLTAEQGSSFSAEQGSSLSTEQGSSFSAEQGSSLSAEQGSSFSAEQGSSLSAEQGSSFSAEQGSSLSAEQGSYLSAERGSSFTAEQGSSLSAEQGSSFTADGVKKYPSHLHDALRHRVRACDCRMFIFLKCIQFICHRCLETRLQRPFFQRRDYGLSLNM